MTTEGDVLDLICLEHYGFVSDIEEEVLKNNAGLAKKGPIFSEGINIFLPEFDIPDQEASDLFQLW